MLSSVNLIGLFVAFSVPVIVKRAATRFPRQTFRQRSPECPIFGVELNAYGS